MSRKRMIHTSVLSTKAIPEIFRGAFLTIIATLLGVSLAGCGAPREEDPAAAYRLENCKPSAAAHTFEETPFFGSKEIVHSFQNLRASLNSACASCHMSPATSGGFSYHDALFGEEVSLGGKIVWLPGFTESAERMRASIFHADPEKQMPPTSRRQKNPQAFLDMGREIDTWIAAGKPAGAFQVGVAPETRFGKPRPVKTKSTSDLGDCVPEAKAVGSDYEMDRLFENASELPKSLTETDLVSLDPLELAQKGTLAYNVEYPLWADNADKGRWIHVPWVLKNGRLQKQSVQYDPETRQFKIPENTRFYKSFYKAITLPNKKIRMKRVETRLIVARTPAEKSLFGTYQWDETEQVATLVTAPYRDGSPWKDLIFDIEVDQQSGKYEKCGTHPDLSYCRPYAIPGRQRCLDCHNGSPTQNFVLGFQPLQINKRLFGEAGRLDPALAHDVSQVRRFIDYGLLSGIQSSEDLPKLENSGKLPPRNDFELRANGYTIGNCYHCHNPAGLAFTKENGIQLQLGPGDLFSFNTQQKSVQLPNRRIVHQNGELDSSHIWRKVSDSSAQLGMFSQMPMHTPGSPDCRVLSVIGQWVRSFESLEAAETWKPECKKQNEFRWIDMDFTFVQGETYVPRRADWKDPVQGMSQRYREIELSPSLEAAIKTEFPVGYWLKKPICEFPAKELSETERLPWMMRGAAPKRPFGEIYSATPGAYFFRNTCMKCHGPKADGDSSLARGILNWSGGKVRVANFVDGMFGKKGENLKEFDLDGKNYAGPYLIWMAMEGTRVQFPPEVASFMGKHGGQMLNGIREKCLSQISIEKASSAYFMDHELFRRVCFMDNLYAGHPDLAFDPVTTKPLYPERVEAWLDRAAWNAGWAIFEYLREFAGGKVRPNIDQCEIPYRKGSGTTP